MFVCVWSSYLFNLLAGVLLLEKLQVKLLLLFLIKLLQVLLHKDRRERFKTRVKTYLCTYAHPTHLYLSTQS